jgi:hypothetical protein
MNEDGPETLVSAGWDQITRASLGFSFTRAVIDTLQDLNGQADTVAGIYSRIYQNVYQNRVNSCPVHISKQGSPSITLTPLGSKPVTRGMSKTKHRVLLSVHIQDRFKEPDLQKWTSWLTKNIPPRVLSVDVKIESVYESSGLLLVTLPVEIWTTLDHNDLLFNFIAHVNSNNILPQLESNIQFSLASLPPSGRENQPFSYCYPKSLD